MKLGAFSISLSVKDIAASREFYFKLGFAVVGGDQAENWLILRNGSCTIGIFKGMFEGNLLTFNPGWDSEDSEVKSFQDVREIESILQEQGLELSSEVETDSGPGSFMVVDPDGNSILFDQHV